MSYDCYHSYPQLLQWKVLCLLVPKIPHTAVLTALEVADIFFRFCDWQVGHLGLFCHSLATAFARAICSGEGRGPVFSLKMLKASSAVFSSHLKKTLMYWIASLSLLSSRNSWIVLPTSSSVWGSITKWLSWSHISYAVMVFSPYPFLCFIILLLTK